MNMARAISVLVVSLATAPPTRALKIMMSLRTSHLTYLGTLISRRTKNLTQIATKCLKNGPIECLMRNFSSIMSVLRKKMAATTLWWTQGMTTRTEMKSSRYSKIWRHSKRKSSRTAPVDWRKLNAWVSLKSRKASWSRSSSTFRDFWNWPLGRRVALTMVQSCIS